MKKVLIGLLVLCTILFVIPKTTATKLFDQTYDSSAFFRDAANYPVQLDEWEEEGMESTNEFFGVISPSSFTFTANDGALIAENQLYLQFLEDEDLDVETDGSVFQFNKNNVGTQTITIPVDVDQSGLYRIGLDYFSETTSINDIELGVKVNGIEPFYEASQIVLNTFWETPKSFNQDRYGNDIMPNASQVFMWHHAYFRDASRLYEQGLLFRFDEGVNEIEITRKNGYFLLGQIYVQSLEVYPDYQAYLSYEAAEDVTGQLITVQAEAMNLKNDISIRYGTDRNPTNYPFSMIESRLNVVDGATYDNSGNTVYYDIEVTSPGYYYITLKGKQAKSNSAVYRTITIDGKVPFKEAERVFIGETDWNNMTLSDDSGNWYRFFLSTGTHRLGLEANAAPFRTIYQTIQNVMTGINTLALDIRKLTGNQVDENRDWEITDYLPNIETDMRFYGDEIYNVYQDWIRLNKDSRDSEISSGLKAAYTWIYELAGKPNDIPANINRLTGATASVMQRLGIVLPLTISSPLTFDVLYVHSGDAYLPHPKVSFFEGLWIEIQRFFISLFSDQFGTKNDPAELNIWVNRSRQYVNLMQQMADDAFYSQTGIKVRISLMPNEDKLILATASNTQPDIAMGVAGWRPYDFAIRNALVDLTDFDTFNEVASEFKKGAFMQLIYQEGVYGLPETQNYNLLFYRKDILDSLNLDIPDTWNDVLDMLPELQRYGMNFYSMLSSSSAFKSFSTTMPFIMQHQGALYTEGALSTALDSQPVIDAMTLMTDLYTVYALPLEVGSFYNNFRYGTMPIGIGDFGMYVQLLHAAPEIAGLWGIAPIPGIEHDGVVDRSYDGASTSAMIFKNSSKQNEAWQFLSWWMSKDVQASYAESLMTSLGSEYMWNTANVEAFNMISLDSAHKAVILEQWNWVLDTAKTPASYMLERELSNAWNRIVYDGVNVRTAMEDAEVLVNKEITRKMIEFRFIDAQGNVLKTYLLPTKETLDEWIEND